MTKETKQATELALREAAEQLGSLDFGSDEYNKTLGNIEKLYSTMNAEEKANDQLTKDYDLMISNEKINEARIAEDKKKRRGETILRSVEIGLATGLTILTLGIEAGGSTVTQTFRNIYSSTLGKIFKSKK